QLMAQFHAREVLLKAISPPVHFVSSSGREPGSNLPLPSVAMGRLDFKWQPDLRPVSARPIVDRLAPDYRRTALTTLFVARWPGDGGDDGYLQYETLTRLTEGIVDWP